MLMDPFATGGCGFALNCPQWTTPYKYLFSQVSLKQLRLYLITASENIFIFNWKVSMCWLIWVKMSIIKP